MTSLVTGVLPWQQYFCWYAGNNISSSSSSPSLPNLFDWSFSLSLTLSLSLSLSLTLSLFINPSPIIFNYLSRICVALSYCASRCIFALDVSWGQVTVDQFKSLSLLRVSKSVSAGLPLLSPLLFLDPSNFLKGLTPIIIDTTSFFFSFLCG